MLRPSLSELQRLCSDPDGLSLVRITFSDSVDQDFRSVVGALGLWRAGTGKSTILSGRHSKFRDKALSLNAPRMDTIRPAPSPFYIAMPASVDISVSPQDMVSSFQRGNDQAFALSRHYARTPDRLSHR